MEGHLKTGCRFPAAEITVHGMFERKPGITGFEVHHDLGVDQNYKWVLLRECLDQYLQG